MRPPGLRERKGSPDLRKVKDCLDQMSWEGEKGPGWVRQSLLWAKKTLHPVFLCPLQLVLLG